MLKTIKILSFVLCLVMVLSAATMVFAAGNSLAYGPHSILRYIHTDDYVSQKNDTHITVYQQDAYRTNNTSVKATINYYATPHPGGSGLVLGNTVNITGSNNNTISNISQNPTERRLCLRVANNALYGNVSVTMYGTANIWP